MLHMLHTDPCKHIHTFGWSSCNFGNEFESSSLLEFSTDTLVMVVFIYLCGLSVFFVGCWLNCVKGVDAYICSAS